MDRIYNASMVGHLIGSSIKELTQTAKTKINEIVFYEKYNRREILKNKYFDKGNLVESTAREMLSEYFDEFLAQDEEKKQNEWVKGYRDIFHNDLIIEIKSSFNFDSFFNTITKPIDKIYQCQVDSYMELWGLKKAKLCHVLCDTPSDIILQELRYTNDPAQVLLNHIFSVDAKNSFIKENTKYEKYFENWTEIPASDRIFIHEVEYDQERIDKRNHFIKLARHYESTGIIS